MADSAFHDHLNHPRNVGRIDRPDGVGRGAGSQCADTMTITIRIADDTIADIAFDAQGCAEILACGSAVTELARGRHLDEAAEISAETVVAAMNGLPAEKRHLAQTAAEALANAIWDYIVRQIEDRTD